MSPSSLRADAPRYVRVPSYRLSTLSTTRTDLDDDTEDRNPFDDLESYDDEDAGDDSTKRGRNRNGEGKGLEGIIDAIGMGRYQWRLLILCGLGWLCDNMYLCCLAIILPRVQDHFLLSSAQIATLSASMFLGMMLGAIGWGSSSDTFGRTVPFNATLALTGIFGLASSYAQSFTALRVWVFLLGTAVGGSMPTDGTIFIENCPVQYQFILTGLSVFFSLGAIISSLLGLLVIPTNSCPEGSLDGVVCDVNVENKGWRYLLRILGALTLIMFACRLFLFRLRESPRFLVTTGKPEEALQVLRQIASYNGDVIEIDLDDIVISASSPPFSESLSSVIPDEGDATPKAEEGLINSSSTLPLAYHSTASNEPRPQFSFKTPTREQSLQMAGEIQSSLEAPPPASTDISGNPPHSRGLLRPGPSRMGSRSPLAGTFSPKREPPRSTRGRRDERKGDGIMGWIQNGPVGEIGHKMEGLFVKDWRVTTVLVWIIWAAMSLAYTMFNSFLPILLEDRVDPTSAKSSRVESLEELVLYNIAGCPGALLGAYMIETPFGRRKTLGSLTILTSLATLAFSMVETKAGVIVSSMAISVSGAAMYAVLYGLTPELFTVKIRGTATGTAAAMSRLTGIIAPLLTGRLLTLSRSFPLWTSSVVFVLAGACAFALPYERAEDVERQGQVRGDEVRGPERSEGSVV